MDLPEYRAAARRLEMAQEQLEETEQEVESLEQQKTALKGSVALLKAVDRVRVDLNTIQPEKTLTGAIRGVSVEQIGQLKQVAVQKVATDQQLRKVLEENQRLESLVPTIEDRMRENMKRQRMEQEIARLREEREALLKQLEEERARLDRVLDFLEGQLPEQFQPLVQEAVTLFMEENQIDEQERGNIWEMEL